MRIIAPLSIENRIYLMRKLMAPVLLIMLSAAGYAQSKNNASASSLKTAVEKIAADFYQDFANIKGDTLRMNNGVIEFKSKITPPGALSTSLSKYTDPYSYTWQAVMYESETFDSAVVKYKSCFSQLNNCQLTFYDKSTYRLSGMYDVPDESRSFASSILSLNGHREDLSLFKVEISLVYQLPSWTVKIMVYEKTADSDIRPTPRVRQ